MRAAGWKDKGLHYLLSTRGTPDPGEPSIKQRVSRKDLMDVYTKSISVPRPKIVELIHDRLNTIDVANHHRQSTYALEEAWKTKFWGQRIMATTLGIAMTNAWLLYTHFSSLQASGMSLMDFAEKVR